MGNCGRAIRIDRGRDVEVEPTVHVPKDPYMREGKRCTITSTMTERQDCVVWS